MLLFRDLDQKKEIGDPPFSPDVSLYHENMQDFLYSWDASQRGLMPSDIITEIPEHRCRNIMPWIEKIYANKYSKLHGRFLEELFDVKR